MNKKRTFFQFVLRMSLALSAAGVLSSCAAKLNAPISLGNDSTVVTQSGFALSPTIQTLTIGGTLSFSASGGIEPYTFDVYYGGGAVQSSSGLYTAPQEPGDAVIRAIDAQGANAYAGILITDAPVISPSTVMLAVGNTYPFSAAGGSPPYVFSVVSGGGSIESANGRFTAPSVSSSVVIRVTDVKGRSSDSTVTVGAALAISPDSAVVAISGTENFLVSGGSGSGYRYSVVSGAGMIDPATGVFSAPPTTGMVAIKVEDSIGNIDIAFVTISNPLVINPPQITIAKGMTYSFSASGGKTSYTYSVPSGAHGAVVSTTGVYTAPGTAGGPYTVTVTDADGQSSSASVTVTESLGFNIPNVTLAVADTFDFATIVSGGVGSVSYSVPSSQGSFSLSTYIAPGTPGIYTVTATDSQLPIPNTAQATVIVNPALSLLPAAVTLAVGNSQSFSAAGGVPPYAYSASSGSIDVSSGAFTAPASPGSATITVTDARSHTATASVTVNAALAIVPSSKTLTTGSSFDFDASGGVVPYSFSVISGGGGVISSSGLYTAPGAAGTASLRVTDAVGNTGDAAITLVAPLAISPSTISLLKDTGIVFSGNGGLPPYSFSVITGGGSINSASGAYTAPSVAGPAIVQVTDALGGTALSAVTIYDGLTISPFSKTMVVGTSFTFSASGGVTPYSYSVTSDGGSVGAANGNYAAPGSAGSALVRVTDAQGNTSDASVTIHPALAISPTAKTLAVNNGTTFSASGGLAPYTFSIFAGGGTINPSSGDYTAPAASGSATVRVTDSSGAYADAAVTISGAIAISPSSKSILASASFGFGATGGVGAYTYSVSSGGGSFSVASYTAPATPGSAIVRVTDTLGNYSEASVTIYEALQISPASKSLAVNNTFTFSANGGVLPYTFSKFSGDGTVAASGLYTAPGSGGSATVRVTDSVGNTSDAAVTINGALAISPTSATVAAGATQIFSGSNGVAPYAYSVLSGGGSFSGGTYTAASTAAGASGAVRVTDSIGNTADATITVPAIAVAISAPTASSVINNSNKASFAVSGTCSENGQLVTVASAGVTSATPSCSAGAWNTTLNFTAVSDGAITITADHANASAVAATQASVSLSKDATLPTVALSAPLASSYITGANQTAITVSGTCSENSRAVSIAAGSVSASPTCSSGSFTTSLDLSPLSDGAVSITADQSDAAGNSATQASVGVTKDIAVSAPASIDDGLWWNSLSVSPTITWGAVTDSGTGLNRYEIAIGTSAGGTQVVDWLSTATDAFKQFSGLGLSDATVYYASVRAVDNAGNTSSVIQGNGWTVDVTAPTAPGAITVGAAAANPVREIPTLTFAAGTDTGGSGISKYQIQIYDNSGPTLVKDWTDASTSGSGTITLDYSEGSSFLTNGATYYVKVRAVDVATNDGASTTSGTWLVMTDLCMGNPAIGTGCEGGALYMGQFDGGKYMVTPSGCGDIPAGSISGGSGISSYALSDFSPNGGCPGSADTLTKVWDDDGGNAYDIPGVETFTTASQASSSSYRGAVNTAAIVAITSAVQGGYHAAARYCDKLSYGGYTDWYLPSKSEFAYLYCHALPGGTHNSSYPLENPDCTSYGGKTSELTGFAASPYWSSTEDNATYAWLQHFGSGNQLVGTIKSTPRNIRCIRRFVSPDTTPPTAPGVITVGSGPANPLRTIPTLTFAGSTDDNSVRYQVQIYASPADTLVRDWTDATTTGLGSVTLNYSEGSNFLTDAATYYAKVRAVDVMGNSGSSTTSGTWTVDPCAGTPARGTVCTGGGLYMGQFDGGKYMVMPSGCSDIPAGSISGGSGSSSYALSDFTPTCSGGTDTLKKNWNDGSSNWYDVPGVETLPTAPTVASSSSYRGSVNTAAIISITSPAQGGYHAAARYCDKLNYGGHTDWYLPSKSELAYLYCHAQPALAHNALYPSENPNCTSYGGKTSELTGFANDYYWSSTEYSNYDTWNEYFANGSQVVQGHNVSLSMRCVRRY